MKYHSVIFILYYFIITRTNCLIGNMCFMKLREAVHYYRLHYRRNINSSSGQTNGRSSTENVNLFKYISTMKSKLINISKRVHPFVIFNISFFFLIFRMQIYFRIFTENLKQIQQTVSEK